MWALICQRGLSLLFFNSQKNINLPISAEKYTLVSFVTAEDLLTYPGRWCNEPVYGKASEDAL